MEITWSCLLAMCRGELLIILDIPDKPIPYKAPQYGSKRTFNPRYQEKQHVQWILKQQYNGEILTGALSICFAFYFEVPKSWSKKKKEKALKGEIRPTKRPDNSNMLKFIEDCMIGIVIEDDSLAVHEEQDKWYSEKAHTVIKIETLYEA